MGSGCCTWTRCPVLGTRLSPARPEGMAPLGEQVSPGRVAPRVGTQHKRRVVVGWGEPGRSTVRALGLVWQAGPGFTIPRKGEHHPPWREHTEPAACAMVPQAKSPAPAGTWARCPHTVPAAFPGTASGARRSPSSATHRLRGPGEVTHLPCALVLPRAAKRPRLVGGSSSAMLWVVSLTP